MSAALAFRFDEFAASNEDCFAAASSTVPAKRARPLSLASVRNDIQSIVTTYEYDRSSLPTRTIYPNGTSAVTTYDNAKRVATMNNRQGASVVSSYSYTYDTNGNRLTQSEANGGVAESTTYAYDNNDRLTTVAYPDKATVYTYDAGYNRLTERTTLVSSTVEADKTYNYNPRNQLATIVDNVSAANSVAYTYDANGNQTQKTKAATTTTFVYDVRDQLIAVRENASTLGLFGYDYQGMRVTKDMGGQILRYTYDDDSVLVESDNAGATIAKYDYGATRLLSLTHATEGRQFYLFDALGSVSNLTNNAGNIQARYQYDAFGNFRAQAGASFNRFGFTGHEKDVETNLYYFKARFYDPDTGRFLSQDSYLGDVNTPPSLHRYLYAYANPTVYVDLNGYAAVKWDSDDFVRAFGGLTGAALGVAMTAVSLAELTYDLSKDSVLAQAGDPSAILRNYERGQTVAHVVTHPLQTAKAIGAHYSAEFEGANREEAQGNIFTAAIIRGKTAGEITLAIDAGVGLARSGVALGKSAMSARGAGAAEELGGTGGRGAPTEGKIVGEPNQGPASPTPAEPVITQQPSSNRLPSNNTPATAESAVSDGGLYKRGTFRKSVDEKVKAEIPRNEHGDMICTTCGDRMPEKIVQETKNGPREMKGHQNDHYPKTWAERVQEMKQREAPPTRKEVLDEYNRDLRGICPECNEGHAFEGVQGQFKGVEKPKARVEEE